MAMLKQNRWSYWPVHYGSGEVEQKYRAVRYSARGIVEERIFMAEIDAKKFVKKQNESL